jgi:hypothetical protein
MRLPLLVTVLALSAPAASAGPSPAGNMPAFKPGPSHADGCPPTSRYHAAKDGRRGLSPQRLGDLPMADGYAAVYRHIGRCEAPIIVRYGIGREQR